MVQIRYALKRDGKMDSELFSSMLASAERQNELEKSEFASGFPSPKSEMKRVVVVVLPRWITCFIKDKV